MWSWEISDLNSMFEVHEKKYSMNRIFAVDETNLKRVPAFERYVGGGEARAFDACLSRLSVISLWKTFN